MPTRTIEIDAPEGLPSFTYSREFDAPIAKVFTAFTDPELIPRWLGPREYEMVVDHFDVRTGGSYRYTHRGADGDAAFRGSYHWVEAPSTVIQTFEFEGFPGEVSLEFMRLEPLGENWCRASFQSVFRSVEARDGLLASGMERGLNDSHDRLDEVIAGL